MPKVNFTKMVASGNDFVVISGDKLSAIRCPLYAKKMCDRKYGIGADGLLVLGKSRIADIRMRIFNADGSEAEMCGNGARCAALYAGKKSVDIETKAGIIESKVDGNNVKIKLTDPHGLRLDIPIKVNDRILKVNFINTGVPHTVIFVEGLDKIDVFKLGRQIRYHRHFAPRGTNVNFVEVLNSASVKVRTYERGVEDETLACGTGSVASALVYAICYMPYANSINVLTKGGEVLRVYFKRKDNKIQDVWLEGKARISYKGECYV
jgi:diaminopimelate epimerase